MIVYRFERNGIGPYIGGYPLFRPANKKAAKKAKHFCGQIPRDYSKWSEAHQDRTMLFGCPSKKALLAYFSMNLKPFFAIGYRIRKYEVPDNEVINLGLECSFPVKYHKLKTKKKLEKALVELRNIDNR